MDDNFDIQLPKTTIHTETDPRAADLSMEQLYMQESSHNLNAMQSMLASSINKNTLITKLQNENKDLREQIHHLQEEKNATPTESSKLALAPGHKRDMVKVIAALTAAGCFRMPDGSKASQKYVMEQFGELLGENMSNYAQTLSEAKKQAKADGENFMQTFTQMENWADEYLNS